MVLTARRQGLLEDLRDELLARYEDIDIHVAKLDVSDTSTVLNMPETLPAGFRDVSLLLNNAGLAAGFGSVSEYNMEDLNTMMDVNVKGLGACCSCTASYRRRSSAKSSAARQMVSERCARERRLREARPPPRVAA